MGRTGPASSGAVQKGKAGGDTGVLHLDIVCTVAALKKRKKKELKENYPARQHEARSSKNACYVPDWGGGIGYRAGSGCHGDSL